MSTGGSTSKPTVLPQEPPKPPAKKTAAKPVKAAAKKPKATDYTAQSWAVALLTRLGAPTSAQNVQAVTSWEAAEGGHWNNTAYYNPLNVTSTVANEHDPSLAGSTSMNGVGVQAYQSWEQGLNATVDMLRQGNMRPIMAALHNGTDAQQVANAVVNSPWGTHSIQLGDQSSYGTTTVDTANRTVASSTLDPSKPETVSQFIDSVGSQYGYLSAYIKQPGVGQLLMTAAKEGWNSGEMLSALNGGTVNGHRFPQAKQWWDSTSQSSRQMQALQRTDPASYREQFNTTYTQVSQLATSMGLTVPKARLSQLTTTALWSGWSADQLNEAIGAEFHYKPGQAYAGTAGADIQKFKQLASAYLVPVADKTLGSWTQQALQGKIKPEEFTGYLSEQAKTLFPWMAQAIDGGITPDQYLSPYREAAAKTLELDPGAINFNDPKWMGLVQTIDPKTGQRTENGLANAMTQMRTDPRFGYDRTQGAKDQASAFAASLAHQFGYQGSDSSLSGVSNPAA